MAMDSKRAADVLRGDNDPSATDLAVAAKLGAQALEAWAWQLEMAVDVEYEPSSGKWHCCGSTARTPLSAVLDAMEKEGKG